MKRKIGKYTRLGKVIHALAGTQKVLAKWLGVSQQTCSNKLRGEYEWLLSQLQKVAKRSKTKLSDIFRGLGE